MRAGAGCCGMVQGKQDRAGCIPLGPEEDGRIGRTDPIRVHWVSWRPELAAGFVGPGPRLGKRLPEFPQGSREEPITEVG